MEISFLVIFAFLLLERFGSSITATTTSNVTCIEGERESLLAFKHKAIDRFNRLSTWSGAECCEWHGVGCDTRTGHVVELDLRPPGSLQTIVDNDICLKGELSPSLQNLKHLRYLDLSFNCFYGSIPEFLGSFERLEYLNLSGSDFEGVVPHHLGNLSRLHFLDLGTTFDSGYAVYYNDHRPAMDDLRWVSSLSSLRYLDLSGITIGNHTDWFQPVNMLPSLLTLNLAYCDIINIPYVKFVNFTSLNSLDLSRNGINSTFPLWLSNLTGLMHLNLNANRFHGKFPDFIGTFGALASIDLSSNSFESSLMPDPLCNLSSLVRLDLSLNMFSGPIPSNLGLLSRLEELNLYYNQLSGNIPMSLLRRDSSLGGLHLPRNIGQILRLKYLELGCNYLSGNIPTNLLHNYSSLVVLDLSYNMFCGPIPANLGLLSRLEHLHLHGNQLSGNIPMSLWQLSKLTYLNLSNNSFSGVLSETHFMKLKKLIWLDLSLNMLTLNLSSQWVPPFQLQTFYAGSCNIGPHFPNWLHTQTNLNSLDLSCSSIKDTVPDWFDNILCQFYYLDLSNNQLNGKLPQFLGNCSNQMFMLNLNKFEGSLSIFPSNVQELDLSDYFPLSPISLNYVNLSKNRFTGSIPVYLCKVSSIGILDLSQINLSGKLPECLGNLSQLHVMDLSDNNIFEANLPLSFQNLTNLVTMDIGFNFLVGSIPFWTGENLLNIRFLNLQSNKFTGKIPLQLCRLKALQYLNLAQNNVTGTIPYCFGNLSGMITNQVNIDDHFFFYEESILASMKGIQLVYTKTRNFLTSLDLSSNNITGEIPDSLMNLAALKNLNISRNQLKGQIPMKIGNLNQLESIDFSLNKLSGRIPQSLTSLNFLSYLNLSFNNLSGPIPVGNQLQTVADSYAFKGNDGLCGPPVLKSCKGNNPSYKHADKAEVQDDDDDGLWFYNGMGSGFIFGFLGLLGTLHFVRRWRVAYFEMFENVYHRLSILILLNLAHLRRTFL